MSAPPSAPPSTVRRPESSSAVAAPACDPFVLDRKGRTPAEDTSDEAIRAAILAAQDQVHAARMSA